MPGAAPDCDVESDVGPLDADAMEQIREQFFELDGLVDRTASGLDSVLDPDLLVIAFDDGIGDADWCRFDVKWYRTGYYNFHHVDGADVCFRFDYHPKPGAPERHYHPAPTAPSSEPEESCISVTEPRHVARAVHKLWRRAYETGALATLNTASNPP